MDSTSRDTGRGITYMTPQRILRRKTTYQEEDYFYEKWKPLQKKKKRKKSHSPWRSFMARANSVKTHSSAPLLVNVNVFVRWLNLTERMQAAQCNWRIVKDWKNSLFTFFTLCYFSDRDAFNSLIPYLGKNISFPVIGRLKNPAWFLGCRVPLYWTESWGSDWFGNTTVPIFLLLTDKLVFFAAVYWLIHTRKNYSILIGWERSAVPL